MLPRPEFKSEECNYMNYVDQFNLCIIKWFPQYIMIGVNSPRYSYTFYGDHIQIILDTFFKTIEELTREEILKKELIFHKEIVTYWCRTIADIASELKYLYNITLFYYNITNAFRELKEKQTKDSISALGYTELEYTDIL